MALAPGARIVSASYLDGALQDTLDEPLSLLVVTESGLGKKVPLSQYPQKGRATAGVVTTELLNKDRVLQTMIISEHDSFLLICNGEGSEQATFVKASELKELPRARRGVPLGSGRLIGVVRIGV
jgi:DNA gyrase subunit A